MPLVSVVIPTRDRTDLLATTMRTVQWQRSVDVEVIVVDDGSAVDIRESVAAPADLRVCTVRHDASQGVARARNRGIVEARGDWIAFLDDDDLWSPGKLAHQLERATEDGAGWVYSGAVAVDGHLKVFEGGPPPSPKEVVSGLRGYNTVPAPVSNVMVRAELLSDVGGFDEELMHVADWDLVLRLARAGSPACVMEPDVAYRWHGGNASLRTDELLAEVERFGRSRNLPVRKGVFRRYAGALETRNGRSLRAAGHYARAALLHRDAGLGGARRDLSSAAVALASGLGLGALTTRSSRSGDDSIASYRARAEEWIARAVAI